MERREGEEEVERREWGEEVERREGEEERGRGEVSEMGRVRRTWYLIWLLSVMYKGGGGKREGEGYGYGELWNKHDHHRERG